MDGGLFNRQRPTDRRAPVPSRGESTTTRAVPDESHTTSEPHRSATVSHRQPKKQKSANKLLLTIVIGAVIAVLGLATWLLASMNSAASAPGVDANKYQAIFLNNGQVYFGNLVQVNDQYLKLTKVFYIQDSTTDATSTEKSDDQTTTGDKKLIKLGKEVHGPEDAMIINRDQVTMYENLKSDSEVTKLITQYKE